LFEVIESLNRCFSLGVGVHLDDAKPRTTPLTILESRSPVRHSRSGTAAQVINQKSKIGYLNKS